MTEVLDLKFKAPYFAPLGPSLENKEVLQFSKHLLTFGSVCQSLAKIAHTVAKYFSNTVNGLES